MRSVEKKNEEESSKKSGTLERSKNKERNEDEINAIHPKLLRREFSRLEISFAGFSGFLKSGDNFFVFQSGE